MIKIGQSRRHDNDDVATECSSSMEWSKAVGLSEWQALVFQGSHLVTATEWYQTSAWTWNWWKNDCCFENGFVKKPACWFQSCCSQLAGSQLNGQLAGLAEVGVQHS